MSYNVPDNLVETPELTAADIMPVGVPSVAPDASIAEVLRVMVEYDVAGVAVVENGEIVGIITESDIVARQAEPSTPLAYPIIDAIFVLDAGRSYEEEVRRVLAINASQLMTSPVTSIRSIANLEQIATVMVERDVHPMPVVDEDENYIGIVSRRDLVRVIAKLETRLS